MRKTLLVVIMASLFWVSNSTPSFAYEYEIKSISSSISDSIAKSGKKRIAVVDFTDLQGNVTELGRFIAEELSVDLINTAKGFEVIDRNHLNRILAEHKLSVSGIVDQKTVQKLGQIAGVDALITGSITPLERSIRVVCKVIATDTARVISAAKGDIEKTKAIEELFGKGIGVTSGTTATSASKTQPKSKSLIYMNGFAFELKHCKVSTVGSVNCIVTVTNIEDKEKRIKIGANSAGWGGWPPPTYLYDNEGRQYLAAYVNFGALRDKSDARQRLSPQVPVLVGFKFIDVSPSAQSVTLRLGCFDDEKNEYFTPVLRNIPLSR